MCRLLIAAVLLAAGATMMAPAASASSVSEALPAATAGQLDGQPIAFTASAARRERMMTIQQNMEEQRRFGRSGGRGYGGGYDNRGYDRDPNYRRRPGNLPPYGYRRPHSNRW